MTEKIIKLHNDYLANLTKELNEQKSIHPDFRTKDDVLNELTDLFENSVGEEFSKEDLLKIYTEGEKRYLNEVPPGYKDFANKKSKGQRHIYGDLIIWKELINNTKNKKQPLIFITDDRKEDWWTIQKGKTLRPREELIKEFFDVTGIRILIYNADNFLQFAKEKGLLPKLKDETIEEVKEIRVNDETEYKNSRIILGAQNLSNKTLSELLENQTYKPFDISEIFSSQAKASNSLSEYFNTENYKPFDISEMLSSHARVTKNIADLYNTANYRPQEILEKLRRGKNAINDATEITNPLSTKNLKTEIKQIPKFKPKPPKDRDGN